MTRGAKAQGSPLTVGSHWTTATSGFHGSTAYEGGSGMAAMSGSAGDWPSGPAAKPAKPAPPATNPSAAEAGTSLAHGLPCMSTNMARMNSTPSRRTASTRSSVVTGTVDTGQTSD